MRIAALVESVDHVCCRYRVAAFRPYLEQAGHSLELVPIPKNAFARWSAFRKLAGFDAAILLRKLLSAVDLAILRQYARRIIFDIDDAVWLRDSYAAKGIEDPKRLRRFRATCREADLVTAGNDFLRDNAEQAGAISVRIQTCVDPARYAFPSSGSTDGKVRLVWIGSSSTIQGIERVAGWFDALANKAILRIVCDRTLAGTKIPVEFVPWSEAGEAEAIHTSDIGISWIPDDDWSRGKCGLKTLQYMAAGLPVVANPVGVHPAMIRECGILADGSDGWVSAITRMIDDAPGRKRLGTVARQTVLDRYSVEVGANLWLEAIDALRSRRKSA